MLYRLNEVIERLDKLQSKTDDRFERTGNILQAVADFFKRDGLEEVISELKTVHEALTAEQEAREAEEDDDL